MVPNYDVYYWCSISRLQSVQTDYGPTLPTHYLPQGRMTGYYHLVSRSILLRRASVLMVLLLIH
jgi:hypothetical protein